MCMCLMQFQDLMYNWICQLVDYIKIYIKCLVLLYVLVAYGMIIVVIWPQVLKHIAMNDADC